MGVWTFAFDRSTAAEVRSPAAGIERLGHSAIWVGEAAGREAFTHAALLLDATERIVVANGIARIGLRRAWAPAVAQRGLAGLVAWGTAAEVAARVRDHLDAGADHVCVQPIDITGSVVDIEGLAQLAAELALTNGGPA